MACSFNLRPAWLLAGGFAIAELPEVAGTAPLQASEFSGPSSALLLAGVSTVTVSILALGGAAWYARRRWGNPAT